jgi:tetratricopeptide (TPR) repeat protein
MRSSSVRTVTLVLACFGLAPALASGLGCNAGEQPAPKKLERRTPFDRGGLEKRERNPHSPLRNPGTETPAGRDGPQLSEEEIDAALAEAAELAKIGHIAQERIVLRTCANKTPPSARCDGRMGLSMIPYQNQRATALYYLREAAELDDPKADAALYRQIGEERIRHGQREPAVAAMEKAIARDASAEYLFAFGQLLSLIPDRLAEGADRMAEARGKDDRIEWLYEEAVIRGQIPIREQAEQSIALFREYAKRAEQAPSESLAVPPASVAARVSELEIVSKQYPTAAEYEQAQAKAAEPNPS